MSQSDIIRYSTPEECKKALQGMLDTKRQWMEYARNREVELALV